LRGDGANSYQAHDPYERESHYDLHRFSTPAH
jgi:hypothetical protein